MIADRLSGLQLLRALAAIMVLIGHVIAEAEHYFSMPLPGDAIPWTRGVDIFFVISGFVITLSAQRYVGRPAAFMWRRLVRVVPLYWLFTTLMVITLVVLPSGAKDTSFDPAQIIASYTFIPYERVDGRIAPVLSLGWTLNYEVFFYALAACCLGLPRPLIALAGLIVSLSVLGLLMLFETPQLTFWTNPIILEFMFGLGLARLWQMGWCAPSGLLAISTLLLGFLLLVALDAVDLPRFIAAGLPAALIVAAGTLFCPKIHLPGMIWGDASYALYLSHRFVLRAATLILLPLLPANLFGALIYVMAVFACAMTIGLLTHLILEKPMMKALTTSRTPVPA